MISPGHRQRTRDRFLNAGVDGLEDHELLEVLLAVAVPRVDTKATAWALIRKFGSFASVVDATPKELQEVMGVGPAGAAAIKIVKGAATAYLKQGLVECDAVSSPEAVARYSRMAWAGEPNESVHALFIDNRNRVRRAEQIATGTVNRAAAYPRKVVESALQARATGVILVHNHPSGSLDPSAEDERFTCEAQQALKTVDIRLVDHVIVSRDGWLSFRTTGRLG